MPRRDSAAGTLPTLWAHAPCKKHAGVHDGSPQDGDGGVLRLQLILPNAWEADGEVLPLVEHCGEAEVRWMRTLVGGAASGRQEHPPLSGGRLDSAEKVRYIT